MVPPHRKEHPFLLVRDKEEGRGWFEKEHINTTTLFRARKVARRPLLSLEGLAEGFSYCRIRGQ